MPVSNGVRVRRDGVSLEGGEWKLFASEGNGRGLSLCIMAPEGAAGTALRVVKGRGAVPIVVRSVGVWDDGADDRGERG